MPAVRPPQGLEDADYKVIEAAVMETERGRWFLFEHARRTREAETSRLMESFGRIEDLVRQQSEANPGRHLADRLAAMEERLLDLAWSLRARGAGTAICELVDQEIEYLGQGPVEANAPQARIPAWSDPAGEAGEAGDRCADVAAVSKILNVEAPEKAATIAIADDALVAPANPGPAAQPDATMPMRERLRFFA